MLTGYSYSLLDSLTQIKKAVAKVSSTATIFTQQTG